ncbi:MAG: hypothetical protein PHN49_09685 [Candidatus Omnitrophica bacterium]|nr:hypothetical protein [Candidatus Omnitrophota bacterium]MDD5671899.1 hypothetical protein [Candidatus Omnitrophota bacterium]
MPSLKYYQHTILFFLLILLVSGFVLRQAVKQIQKVSRACAVDIEPRGKSRASPSDDLRRLRMNSAAQGDQPHSTQNSDDLPEASKVSGQGIAQ